MVKDSDHTSIKISLLIFKESVYVKICTTPYQQIIYLISGTSSLRNYLRVITGSCDVKGLQWIEQFNNNTYSSLYS